MHLQHTATLIGGKGHMKERPCHAAAGCGAIARSDSNVICIHTGVLVRAADERGFPAICVCSSAVRTRSDRAAVTLLLRTAQLGGGRCDFQNEMMSKIGQ